MEDRVRVRGRPSVGGACGVATEVRCDHQESGWCRQVVAGQEPMAASNGTTVFTETFFREQHFRGIVVLGLKLSLSRLLLTEITVDSYCHSVHTRAQSHSHSHSVTFSFTLRLHHV